MRIHLDPISTTSRPVLLFLAEHGHPAEITPVRLFQGEHLTAAYAALNPNKCVPTLVDGDFVLTECSAILKYLADKTGSPAYPQDLQPRAHVNALMDWFNTGFYRDFGYGIAYQQVFPQYRYDEPAVQAALLERNTERAAAWLAILDQHWLGGKDYFGGDRVTLADYLGACYVSLGEWIGYDLGRYPAVTGWMARMKARPSWGETHDAWNALTASFRTPAAKTA